MLRGGGVWVAGSQSMSTAVHRSPNKLWRSNSIFYLWEELTSGGEIHAGICKQSMGARNQIGIWVVVPAREATQPGGIGSLESILGLLKKYKNSGSDLLERRLLGPGSAAVRMSNKEWTPMTENLQVDLNRNTVLASFSMTFYHFYTETDGKSLYATFEVAKKLLCLTCGKLPCRTWGWLGEDTNKRKAEEEVPSVEDKEHSRGCRLIRLRSNTETVPCALIFTFFLFTNRANF
jgi:hypothetical protein